MLGHILPNILPEILVMGSLWMATAIRVEASLAFIGLLGIATGDSWTFEVRAMKVDESASTDWQVGLACRAA